jgi:hypothetical protein
MADVSDGEAEWGYPVTIFFGGAFTLISQTDRVNTYVVP